MTTHHLKIWPEYFSAVGSGEKTCELRRNDRGFMVGDYLDLREFFPIHGRYSGRSIDAQIIYMTSDVPGLQEGFCLLCIRKIEKIER